jgi:predicted RNase H-like HicB family nuclease
LSDPTVSLPRRARFSLRVNRALSYNAVGEAMNNIYTAVIKQDGDWWIGWIEEVPGVNCQESSRDELLESLKLTLREALEFNKQDAIAAAGGSYQEELIPV